MIDQFRADYLTRFQSQFLPATRGEKLGGFNFLMQKGAYFPFAEYDVSQCMTCSGHAIISTGSYPSANGIVANDYYDRVKKKIVYCADDEVNDLSPNQLTTTTFSDELKNSGASSKVIGIALKDRSAIMLGGHRADMALWMNTSNFQWQTSPYYGKKLPSWVDEANKKIAADFDKEKTWNGKKYVANSKLAMTLDYGVNISLALAEQALKSEKLGTKASATDVLAISLSSHDSLGHSLGPNAHEMEAMTLHEDRKLADFLNALQSHLGSLKDVVVVLTADHGIPPTVEYASAAKIDSGKIDYLELYRKVYDRLDQKFGKSAKPWFVASKYFHFYLNEEVLREKNLSASNVEAEAKRSLQEVKGVSLVVTKTDLEKGLFPPGEIGLQLQRQYVPQKSGDLIVIPKPFYFEKGDNVVTHITGYSYDRTVPLIMMGKKFKPGVYSQKAKVIDIAPTLAFTLGVIAPATSEGKVLDIF